MILNYLFLAGPKYYNVSFPAWVKSWSWVISSLRGPKTTMGRNCSCFKSKTNTLNPSKKSLFAITFCESAQGRVALPAIQKRITSGMPTMLTADPNYISIAMPADWKTRGTPWRLQNLTTAWIKVLTPCNITNLSWAEQPNITPWYCLQGNNLCCKCNQITQ